MESLNQQLLELGQSETLSRARDQHEAVVSTLQQRYEQEALQLKEKVDETAAALEQEREEVEKLQRELQETRKAAEEAHFERAEVMNRLTRSLEDSQKQCRELLQTGTVQEIGQLKIQLQQANTAKALSEGMYQALQDELTELKEQLQMYENAAQFGVFATPPNDSHSDSYVQLGIKKDLDWKTPKIHRPNVCDSLTPEEVVVGLKAELERSLSTNRSKRGQVTRLQGDLRAMKADLETWKARAETSERKSNDLEMKVKTLERDLELSVPGGSSAGLDRLQKELDTLRDQYNTLDREYEDVKLRLEEVSSSEEQLNELNQQLKRDMAQMVSEFDQDKTQAVEKAQQACLQLHEDSTNKLRHELEQQFAEQRDADLQACEKRVADIQAELDQALQELDGVKEDYIQVCGEKDSITDRLREEHAEEMEQKLAQVQEECAQEKQDALESLKVDLEDSHKVVMATVREKWSREQEEEMRREIETKVAMAKVEWVEEQTQARKAAMEAAVAMAKVEWVEEQSQARKAAVEAAVKAAEQEWLARHEAESEGDFDERLQQAKQQWQVQQETAVREALVKHKAQWEKEAAENREEEFHRLLATEKDAWFAQSATDKAQAVQTAVNSAEVEWLTKNQETVGRQIEQALIAARSKWMSEQALERQKHGQEMEVLRKEQLEQQEENTKREVSVALKSARLEWEKEQKKQKDQAVTRAVQEASRQLQQTGAGREKQLQETINNLQEELQKLRIEQDNIIQQELGTARAEWDKEQDWEKQELQNKIHEHTRQLERSEGKVQEYKKELERLEVRWRGEFDLERQRLDRDHEVDLETVMVEKERLKDRIEQLEQQCKRKEILMKKDQEILRSSLASEHQRDRETWEQDQAGQQEIWERERASLESKLAHSETRIKRLEERSRKELEFLQKNLSAEQKDLLDRLEEEKRELTEELRRALEEKGKLEGKLQGEKEKLRTKLEGKYTKEISALETRISELEKERAVAMATGQPHPSEKRTEMVQTPCQTDFDVDSLPDSASEGMHELRNHYLTTVNKIKDDVKQFLESSRSRTAESLKKEVTREKHLTGRKLRRYYLQCLHQLLEEEKREGGQGSTLNSARKMAIMARALESALDSDRDDTSTTSAQDKPRSGPRTHHAESVGSESHTAGVSTNGNSRSVAKGTRSRSVQSRSSEHPNSRSGAKTGVTSGRHKNSGKHTDTSDYTTQKQRQDTMGSYLEERNGFEGASSNPKFTHANSAKLEHSRQFHSMESLSTTAGETTSGRASPVNVTVRARDQFKPLSAHAHSMEDLTISGGKISDHKASGDRRYHSSSQKRERDRADSVSSETSVEERTDRSQKRRQREVEKSSSRQPDFIGPEKYRHQPIAKENSRSGDRRQPMRVPPPNREMQALLAEMSVSPKKPVPLVTRHTQAPSPALSDISADSEYIDLPTRLAVSDKPKPGKSREKENHPDQTSHNRFQLEDSGYSQRIPDGTSSDRNNQGLYRTKPHSRNANVTPHISKPAKVSSYPKVHVGKDRHGTAHSVDGRKYTGSSVQPLRIQKLLQQDSGIDSPSNGGQ
ncbi:PREDICTED: centrosomal protein of 152 kDa-like [Branchiostoma belcheri]|uniref:Centrosomal protein of 152 kDa-like n=1 Tax=Branchiostoma belcheri TaxID=7741 RepID=A0A6P4YKS9_BRABE|nr:PREDICTED: centrosomal protein of 152 kDa-like [Branchiostoma belcheri]